MLNKNLMILTIFLVGLLSITVVSAGDNTTGEIVSGIDNQIIFGNNVSEVGSFSDLETEINNLNEGGILNLEKDYEYSEGSTEGVSINKSITIDGNGHNLDGKYVSRIFHVQSDNVVFKNITFSNGFHQSRGGAIYGDGNNITWNSCNFISCCVNDSGGAICWGFSRTTICNYSINNCRFDNCSSDSLKYRQSSSGGAIYFCACDNVVINNSKFINCHVSAYESECGAIKFYESSYGFIDNTDFINCYCISLNQGSTSNGAFYASKSTINNCNFMDCFSKSDGIIATGGCVGLFDSNLTNCNFINCYILDSAEYYDDEQGTIGGGAVYSMDNNHIFNCSFVNCSSIANALNARIENTISSGGAILSMGDVTICNSSFINCYAHSNNNLTYGGAIRLQWDNTSIFNCTFINNSAEYGGSICYDTKGENKVDNCYFANNLACYGGAIFIQKYAYGGFGNVYILNSSFINNSAFKLANSIYAKESQGFVNNSLFFNEFDNFISTNDDFKLIKNVLSINFVDDYKNKGVISTIFTYKDIALPNKLITFNLTNENITKSFKVSTDNNGIAKIDDEIKNLNVGQWTVLIIFEGDDNYYSSNKTVNFTVYPQTSLSIEEINATVDCESVLLSKVFSENMAINGGFVSFFDNGKLLGNVTVVDNVASLIYVPNSAGSHEITAKFTADTYQDSNNTMTLTVLKAKIGLFIEEVPTVCYGNSSKFIVNVSSNSQKLKDGEVKYYVNGILVGSSSIYDGKTSLEYTAKLAGTFDLEVIFDETDKYLSQNISTTFDVIKINTTISASPVTTVYNGGKYLHATLKDSHGNVLSGVKIIINLSNGNVENQITDSNGQVKIPTNGLTPVKTYIATITFKGNSNYEKSIKSVKITVKKATPKLFASKKTYKVSIKTKKYAISLKTNQNKVMKNAKVAIEVNKKVYNAKTNNKGIATFKLTKVTKKGKYNAIVKYSGSKYYNAVTVKTKITVK